MPTVLILFDVGVGQGQNFDVIEGSTQATPSQYALPYNNWKILILEGIKFGHMFDGLLT